MSLKVQFQQNPKEFVRETTLLIVQNAAEKLGHTANADATIIFQGLSNASPFHFHYAPSIWDWSSRNVTYNVPVAALPKSQKDKEEENARFYALMGGIVTLVSGFAVGILGSRFLKEKAKFNHTSEILQLDLDKTPGVPKDFRRLIQKQHTIHSRDYAYARNKLLATAVLLVGGATTLIGGLNVSSVAITAGCAIMLVSTAFFLFNLGYHWDDEDVNNLNYKQIVGIASYSSPNASVPATKGLAHQVLDDLSKPDAAPQQYYVPVPETILYPKLPGFRLPLREMVDPSAPSADA